MLRTIRETIAYVARFQGSRFVVKLDNTVAESAEETGILSDVRLLHEIGIHIALVHTMLEFSPELWPSIKDYSVSYDIQDHFPVLKLLEEKKIPVVFCGEQNDEESDILATDLAVKLKADKLLLATGQQGIVIGSNLVRQCTIAQAEALISEQASSLRHGMKERVKNCVNACRQGVSRVHIISGLQEDSLIGEIFFSEGVGTMFYDGEEYREMRAATMSDISEIREILTDFDIPTLTFVEIHSLLGDFWVLTTDGHVQACVHLQEDNSSISLEISYLATSYSYNTDAIKRELLQWIFDRAKSFGLRFVFLRPDKHEVIMRIKPWFLDFGFIEGHIHKITTSYSLGDSNEKIWYAEIS